jgi:predicted aspartyl protease
VSVAFNRQRGLIILQCEVWGRAGSAVLRPALDTGATRTTINTAPIVALGYDPGLSTERIQVTAGSGVEYAPRVTLDRIRALGVVEEGFPILCHTLPPSAGVDGVLGLDYLRKRELNVNFRTGCLSLSRQGALQHRQLWLRMSRRTLGMRGTIRIKSVRLFAKAPRACRF